MNYKRGIAFLNAIAADELRGSATKEILHRKPNIFRRVKYMRERHPELSMKECLAQVRAKLGKSETGNLPKNT